MVGKDIDDTSLQNIKASYACQLFLFLRIAWLWAVPDGSTKYIQRHTGLPAALTFPVTVPAR